MLRVLQIENRSQISEVFADYNPNQQTWLVSDLRTKFEIQQKILSQRGQYIDESVLRASDLWKLLLKRLDPQLRVVSDSFARTLLREILDSQAEVLGVNSSAEKTVFAYIDEMASIIFHPEGTARLQEWFELNPESKNRWSSWYLRARFCAIKLTEEYKVITADWITSYLQNFNELGSIWKSSLIVDLGGEMSRVEAEIFRDLSRHIEVTILEPHPPWRNEFNYLLRPYEDLRSQAKDVQKKVSSGFNHKEVQTFRFSGMLAEIKNSVGQVREWLEQGVSLDSIAIIAPDIEIYWPVLQAFLVQEGIPAQKDVTHKIQSLPSVMRWLSTLRSKSGRLSSTDLEIAFFQNDEAMSVRFEEFKSLYKSLYSIEDLARNSVLHKLFVEQFQVSGRLSRDEFVAKALLSWSSQNFEVVEIVLRELLQNAVATTQMTWSEWLGYLESIVAAKEFTVERGLTQGLMVTKLMSAHSEKIQYRIFLGLTEESLQSRKRTQLSGQDYFDLAKDVGFYLDNPEESDLEFELRLLAEDSSKHDIFCFGATNLEGALLAPATFWLAMSQDHENVKLPKEVRWDEIQSNLLNFGQRENNSYHEQTELRLSQDLGRAEIPNIVVSELPRVSISSLESFLQCPFVFAAQRYFKLKDFPNIELDVDHRTRGQLAHALFEKLTVEPMRFDLNESDLDGILEVIRKERELIFADDRLWLPLKKLHIQLGIRFLTVEKAWRNEFSKTRTLGREARFEFYLDSQTQEVFREPHLGAFRISGQIDRVDTDTDGQLVVLDYKSSSGGISSHGSWLKKNELQLLFYMWVIEKSLLLPIKGEVIGLFYYVFRTFERKGFRIDEQAGNLFPPLKRKDKNANSEVKLQYLTEFQTLLMATLERIRGGECHPKPIDTNQCSDCEWRRQCRAPHLN